MGLNSHTYMHDLHGNQDGNHMTCIRPPLMRTHDLHMIITTHKWLCMALYRAFTGPLPGLYRAFTGLLPWLPR